MFFIPKEKHIFARENRIYFVVSYKNEQIEDVKNYIFPISNHAVKQFANS